LRKGIGGFEDVVPDADLFGEDIGSAGWEEAEGDTGADDAFGGFVEGAVASGDDNAGGALVDAAAGEAAGRVGTGGGLDGDVPAVRTEALSGLVDEVRTTIDQAGLGIKEKKSLFQRAGREGASVPL